jgi:hypothetical protein
MPTPGIRFPVRFDPDAWETDLARSTPAGRTAAETAKADYERSGVPREHLRPCDPEGRDGNHHVRARRGLYSSRLYFRLAHRIRWWSMRRQSGVTALG